MDSYSRRIRALYVPRAQTLLLLRRRVLKHGPIAPRFLGKTHEGAGGAFGPSARTRTALEGLDERVRVFLHALLRKDGAERLMRRLE